MGFADRSDSFDLNVALQDHFKGIKRDIEIEKENDMTNSANGKAAEMGPKLNLAFKEGQTIRINIPKNEGATKDRTIKKRKSWSTSATSRRNRKDCTAS